MPYFASPEPLEEKFLDGTKALRALIRNYKALVEDYNRLAFAFEHSAVSLSIPLGSFRETDANYDVGNSPSGLLAADTGPKLEAINNSTDGAQRILWAASNNDMIVASIGLPPELSLYLDLNLYMRIASGGTTNAVGFTCKVWFNEGNSVVSVSSETNQTTAYKTVKAIVAANDIPAKAEVMTVGLIPVAHTTDSLSMTGFWCVGAGARTF